VADTPGAGRLWAEDPEAGWRRYLIADVFTSTPLEGNQLAVFPDARGLADDLLQRTALELNLSETVFFLPAAHGGDVRVRIFTKASELPFAGHPVLGSAIVVGAERTLSAVRVETGAGIVPVSLCGGRERVWHASMHQPIPSWQPYGRERELLAALGVARSDLPVESYVNGPTHVYVALDKAAVVVALEPDLRGLAALGELCVSCFAGCARRWETRVFAPALGVGEDPATGSAAGPLAVHLARHGRIAFGEEIEIHQGAQLGRPSLLRACAAGSARRIERVAVGGAAVIVARGQFLLG
jgi:trans-2,3-dihydro-3-hydroxyanthranilate isomerase